MKSISSICLFALIAALPSTAMGGSFTFSTTDLSDWVDDAGGVTNAEVSALFEKNGTTLTVTLTYVSATVTGQMTQGGVLTGLLWDSGGQEMKIGDEDNSIGDSDDSVDVALGSLIIDENGDIYDELTGPEGTKYDPARNWVYKDDPIHESGGFEHGLGAAGGEPSVFANDPIHGVAMNERFNPINGVNFGLVPDLDGTLLDSLNYDPDSYNTKAKGFPPVVMNSLVFTFAVAADFDLDSITNVNFLFGSNLQLPTEPGGPGTTGNFVPEPASMAIFGLGALGMGFIARRRRQTSGLAA